jgi:flagellar L-ring protein FlgH
VPQPLVRGADPGFVPVLPAQPVPPEQNNGAIFQVSRGGGLFDDDKARRVGDILTVRLVERTQARKSANTSTSKESSVQMPAPTLFGEGRDLNGGTPILNSSIEASRELRRAGRQRPEQPAGRQHHRDGGGGTVQRQPGDPGREVDSDQSGRGVHPRAGVVRPVDIRADNTVLSTQIANAQVAYGGSGTLADSNRPGWLTRFFNSPIWPF